MPYLVDVLALKLRDELLKTLVISLNADGLKDLLDVSGLGRGVATEAEEKVCSEVLHFAGFMTARRVQLVKCFEILPMRRPRHFANSPNRRIERTVRSIALRKGAWYREGVHTGL